jgi:hypothetical protein
MANYHIETYNIDVVNGGFERTAQIFQPEDLEYVFGLNKPGYASFNLNINHPGADPSLWIKGRTQVHIVRNNGSTRWFGPLENIDVEYADNNGNVTFFFKEYMEHLKYRITDSEAFYSEQDASLIASDLISTVQARTNGQLNISDGSLATVGDTVDTLQYQTIYDALRNQSDNVTGYDFELVPILDANGLVDSVILNIYKAKGVTVAQPVTLSSIESLSASNYSDFYNYITALSAGTGDDILTVTAEDDAGQKGFTRRENIIKTSINQSSDNLEAAADKAILEMSRPRNTIQVKLDPEVFPVGTINTGDLLRLNIYRENTFLNYQGMARVIELGVTVDNNGKETIEPRLVHYE